MDLEFKDIRARNVNLLVEYIPKKIEQYREKRAWDLVLSILSFNGQSEKDEPEKKKGTHREAQRKTAESCDK